VFWSETRTPLLDESQQRLLRRRLVVAQCKYNREVLAAIARVAEAGNSLGSWQFVAFLKFLDGPVTLASFGAIEYRGGSEDPGFARLSFARFTSADKESRTDLQVCLGPFSAV
jgi:hypothetical protein